MSRMLIINKKDLYTKYPYIGYGDESFVYKYNDDIAIKIYRKLPNEKSKYRRKLLKIKEMIGILKDPNCTFPLGFVSYNGTDIVGIYIPYVKKHLFLDDLDDIPFLDNINKQKEIILKADQTLQRLHREDIIVGDIKPDNILISPEAEPIYVDCDNYKYKNHLFDLVPERSSTLYFTYKTPSLCLRDNDILVFSIMVLNILTQDERFDHNSSKEKLDEAIHSLKVEKEILKELEYIFSPKLDKPYIGSIIKEMKM